VNLTLDHFYPEIARRVMLPTEAFTRILKFVSFWTSDPDQICLGECLRSPKVTAYRLYTSPYCRNSKMRQYAKFHKVFWEMHPTLTPQPPLWCLRFLLWSAGQLMFLCGIKRRSP